MSIHFVALVLGLIMFQQVAGLEAGQIQVTVGKNISSIKEIIMELPDTIEVNAILKSPMPTSQYGIEQLFGRMFTWVSDFSIKWNQYPTAELNETQVVGLSTLTQSTAVSTRVYGIQTAGIEHFSMVNNSLVSVESQRLISRNFSLGSNGIQDSFATDSNINNVLLFTCNTSYTPYCFVYTNASQLCYFNVASKPWSTISCYSVIGKPEKIVILASSRVALLYENTTRIISYSSRWRERVLISPSNITDMQYLEDTYVAICTKQGLYFSVTTGITGTFTNPQYSGECHQVFVRGRTIMVVRNVSSSKTSERFLTELYMTDKSTHALTVVREYNLTPGSHGLFLPYNSIVLDSKRAYLKVSDEEVLVVKHSYPHQSQALVHVFKAPGRQLGLLEVPEKPYSLEAAGYLVVREDKSFVFYSPYKLASGSITCKTGWIAEHLDFVYSMTVIGYANNCPDKKDNDTYNTRCAIKRNIQFAKRKTLGDTSEVNVTLTVALLVPTFCILGGALLLFCVGKRPFELQAQTPRPIAFLHQEDMKQSISQQQMLHIPRVPMPS